DLYVRGILAWGGLPFTPAEALLVSRAAMDNPTSPLEPTGAERDSAAGKRLRIAAQVRKEVERRLLDANQLTYDDLLVRLARTLEDETRGEAACARLRRRYRVVLVDEFQ